MDKLKGYIVFRYEDGYKQEILFRHCLKGIQHNNRRPTSYSVVVAAGTIDEVEAARLNDWFRQITAVLE